MGDFINVLSQPFENFWREFGNFLPNLMAMLIIVAVGILAAWITKWALAKILASIEFNKKCDKCGLTAIIRKADVWALPSAIACSAVYWSMITIFTLIGLNALKHEVIDKLIAQIFLYLPRALSAVFILVIGYVIAGLLSRAVLITAVNSGYHYAKLLAEAVRLLLIILIIAMSLEQLHVAPGIVIAAFSIIFGGIVLALAIAFGVGGIETAKKMIEKNHDEKRPPEDDINHL